MNPLWDVIEVADGHVVGTRYRGLLLEEAKRAAKVVWEFLGDRGNIFVVVETGQYGAGDHYPS